MISIGSMAKMYGLLPSEVAQRATTFDLMVTDILATWEAYRADPQSPENYKQEDLEDLIRSTR